MKITKTDSGLYKAEAEIEITPAGQKALEDAEWRSMVARASFEQTHSLESLKEMAKADAETHEIRESLVDRVAEVRNKVLVARSSAEITKALAEVRARQSHQKVTRQRLTARGLIRASSPALVEARV
jgi:hypothetical protein